MGGEVTKVIELVGHSDHSWEDAVRAAVKEAARTLRGINGVEVMNWTGQVNAQGEITGYRANVHVAFKVEH
ncbi:MAG: dodecin domain-containing protein [Firmicutes bacterium]|nr:dodecin family protein [Bacillota bacterium]NLO65462.1 dodecin domain-containing protein [Bacillota bacterium]